MQEGDLTEDGLTGIAILDFDLKRLPVEERPAAARRALEALKPFLTESPPHTSDHREKMRRWLEENA